MKENVKGKQFKTWEDFLAFGISAIFSPYVVAVLFVVLLTYNYSQNLSQFLPWVLTFLVFGIIIPGIYVLWLMETEKIHDIHISDRNERKIPFLIAGISSTIGAVLLIILGAARPVIVMAVTYAVNALAVAVITAYWKISIHMALLTSIITVAVILFGYNFAWFYFLLLPLAWSRVHRKKHTILQALAGSLLAFILTAVVFWGFKYF
ncbi:TPA: hypothetical protein DD449_03410 [Candidatus Berkelbacteria bacterium]|uniref:Uncharacterized protein n=1 Tax=Berkelbacteria bacterium GW2011_GWE1_39_12 TaxID=1618337 RepID=A0A0G4B3X2_9BACT|nr:MAG: hypothetical protein UT28_C0001G0314 [Berkelbacteria bacterium GW2011_GWE1_39_12]HBO60705.1 hypothetical protein [Candidatus Berkelbacteria bacterium]